MSPRVLIVEDDPATHQLLADGLRGEPFELEQAASVMSGRQALLSGTIDAAVVDIGLPDGSGLDLLEDAAAAGVPVIILSGRSREADRVGGLELGAEDYMVKPYSVPELASRLRRILRTTSSAGRTVTFEDLEIDLDARQVAVRGAPVELTRREFDLLGHLALRPMQVLSREDLLQAVWQSSGAWQTTATVTEHVRRLRAKLEVDPSEPRYLLTVRGVGYRFRG